MQHVSVTHIRQPFNVEVSKTSAQAGCTLQELAPRGHVICRVNGGPGFVSRKQWAYDTRPGDIVEFIEYPADADEYGGIIQIAVATVVAVYTGNYELIALAFASVFASVINEPDVNTPQEQAAQFAGANGLQGNAARLYDPVPKLVGRRKFFPPYAAQPYQEFNESNEQFLFALFAVTNGRLDVERTLIDDTDITHFQDVLTINYLQPGDAPTLVLPNVINSLEVGSQEFLTGTIVGPFVACGAGFTVKQLGIDIVAPRGLGTADSDGNVSGLEVSLRIDIAEVNAFGTRITPFSILQTETFTRASREVQRISFKYDIDPPRRIQVRITRMDVKSTNIRVLNDLVWAGMRAYLNEPAPLNPNVTHLEVVMRSSKQLSGVSQNRIGIVGTGHVAEVLSDGTRGSERASRNPAEILADLWLSPTWGEGLPIDRVDMATLYQMKVLCDARQDRFDYVFESAQDADSAAQLIAGSFRARAFRRGGVRTLWRDQKTPLPRSAFHTRNTRPGSMVDEELLPQDRMPDGYIIEFMDGRSWNYGAPIECPAPGVDVMQDPQRVRIEGVTGRIHATREGLYMAARLAYRRRTVGCVTEMQGVLSTCGTAVRWQTEHMRYWKAGDVVDWDADALLMTLSEPVDWSQGTKQIVLQLDDNTLTEPIGVTPGPLTTQVVLAEDPGFTPLTDDGYRDRTQYLLGAPGVEELIAKITNVNDGGIEQGAQLYEIGAFVDDDRVHDADLSLLPAPGEIQDPVDPGEDTGGGGTLPVVYLPDRVIDKHLRSDFTTEVSVWFTLGGNGVLTTSGNAPGPTPSTANQWLYVSPVDTTITNQFEVMVTRLSGSIDAGDLDPVSSALDTWLSLDADRTWSITTTDDHKDIQLQVQIREIATGLVQVSAFFSLSVTLITAGG